MSTYEMEQIPELSRGPTKIYGATVPGFGEVTAVLNAEGQIALILPDQALQTGQELAAIRRDLGEVRDRLREQVENAERGAWNGRGKTANLGEALRTLDRQLSGNETYEHAWINYPAKPEETPASLVRKAVSGFVLGAKKTPPHVGGHKTGGRV